MSDDAVERLLAYYPRIYFACHTRHVRDERAGRLVSARLASILDHLDEVEATSLAGLAGHMGVTAGTMSVAVERLVRLGYVRRARDRADLRRVRLRLTRAGARLREARSVLDPARVRAMLGHLGAEERRAGIRGLALLARAAEEEMRRRAGSGRKA